MPNANRPGAASAMLATLMAMSAGPAGERGDDGAAEPERRRPRGGQREGRERVGAAGLARPEVGVAEVGGLLEPLALLGQRDVVERDRDAVPTDCGRLIGRLNSDAPSTDGRWRTGWRWRGGCRPRPTCARGRGRSRGRRRGCARRAAAIPSGRRARDPDGVVEAVAARPLTERLADAERHEVAEDRERGDRVVEARDARPQRAAAVARRARQLVEIARVGPRISSRSNNVPRCRSWAVRERAHRRAAAPPGARPTGPPCRRSGCPARR